MTETDMPVKMKGNYPSLERLPSGLWSFDRAAGNIYTAEWGAPMRSIYEIHGPYESGKTSLGLYLSAKAKPKGTILLAALEAADRNYIEGVMNRAGFNGTLEFVPHQDSKGKWMGHSKMLTDAVNRLGNDEDVVCLLLDSLAAIVPPAREDNQIGEGYMTDRARFSNDMCARAEAKMMNRDTPSMFIVLNHTHSSLDPRHKGRVTPGGMGIKYHGAIRVYMYRKEMFTDKKTGELYGFMAEGTMEKNRFGGRGRKFVVYIVPGIGVHVGATAMFDCIRQGLATRDKSGHIKLGGEGMGRIGTLTKAATKKTSSKFDPFIEALANYEEALKNDDDSEPTDGDDEEDGES